MRKCKIKKVFESKAILGQLSILCNIRNSIYFQNKERTNKLIDTFNYMFTEIDKSELFKNEDKIYVIQTISNKYLEIDKEDIFKFEY